MLTYLEALTNTCTCMKKEDRYVGMTNKGQQNWE